MQKKQYAKGEVAARGKEIYERAIRAKVEQNHWGEYLVIDIDTGEYEVDPDHLAASKRAYQKNPDGMRFAMKIGSPVIGRIGFNLRKASK